MKKVVVITGASKGIGRELAFIFAQKGFNLVIASRSLNLLKELGKEIEEKHGVKVLAKSTDVGKREECKELIDYAVDSLGSIDVLINNAGIGLYSPVAEMKEEDLERVFYVNFFGSFYCTKYALPYIKEAGGSVINISSVAGLIPVPFMGGYSASKHAMNALSFTLAMEVKQEGVHVLTVCPGVINTGFVASSLGNYRPKFKVRGSDPSKLAVKVYKYYEKRKRMLIYPWYYRLIIMSYKIFPFIYETVSLKLWKKRD